MRHTFFVALLGLAMFALFATSAHASPPSHGMPATIDPAANYLFFHHNYYVETKGINGDCKYDDILKSFAGKGYTVIAEIRPRDVSVIDYAKKAAADVRTLLAGGVPPEHITVAGHSKGAVITVRIAAELAQPKVNYVVMAGCGIKGLEKGYPELDTLKGRFLSIYASSDKIAGSCGSALTKEKPGVISGKEIALESPAGHQLFFNPADLWLKPVFDWLAATHGR